MHLEEVSGLGDPGQVAVRRQLQALLLRPHLHNKYLNKYFIQILEKKY